MKGPMPNVKRAMVDIRREYMKSLIRQSPQMSGDKLNKLFSQKFKSKMRINTIYDLKEELGYSRSRTKAARTGMTPDVMSQAGPHGIPDPLPWLVPLQEGDTPPDLVARVLEKLAAAGIVNLRMTKGTDWIVLDKAD